MKVNLPNNNVVTAGDAQTRYEVATVASPHPMAKIGSMEKEGANVAFTMPTVFDPARKGMTQGSRYNMMSGYDLLQFDENEEMRNKILLACRNIGKTHPIVNSVVSVYSRFPVQGIKLQHSDSEYERFYTELFLEDLDYKSFFIDIGKVYWIDGNAFAWGNWSDDLGLWVGEDILDPMTIRVERVPFINEDLIYLVPQQELKEYVRGNTVQGRMFAKRFPDMAEAIQRGQDILMSNDRVIMLANKDRPSDLWGTPIMLRAWNTLLLEDRMNAAMRATAERLYAPLTLFTIGGSLPNGDTYIPSAGALNAFRANLDAALSSDFRAIITHAGVQAQEVIRGDRMNNFKNDMDMYDERIMMAWGLTPSIFKPQSGAYATSALEFQLAAQMMASYQQMLINLYNRRAAFVAEANEHYEYEKKGESLSPVCEQKEVWDPDANDGEGGYVVKTVPKLSWPKMTFDVINFKDEQKEREFRMQLRKEGIPIADDDIAIGVDIDLEDSAAKFNEEQKKKKIDEARREQQIFEATKKQGIVIPPDTKTYMEKGIPPLDLQAFVEEYKDESDSTTGADAVNDRLMLDSIYDVSNNDLDMGFANESDVRGRPYESDEMRGDESNFL